MGTTNFEEQARPQRRKTAGNAIGNQTRLTPWREVVHPHKDVTSGHYRQAEFAADLWQVHLGEGSSEYRDPSEFFRRTYLTNSLKQLLSNALQRLAGNDGDPVVQLQTNFGGGKTHSMLALYHLFSGASVNKLPGMDTVMQEINVTPPSSVKRVVLVGDRISPGSPVTKADGTEVRTLWGELAWQLGQTAGGEQEARRAYERVRADDEHATSPGDTLRELLNEYGPSLILIDEWVAYARQLQDDGKLPAGSFETQFTFAQALSSAAKLAKNCLLVISLPASDSTDSPHAGADDAEVGGLKGRDALAGLRNVIGRVDSPWHPASAEESFEIVRRRLFEPIDSANSDIRDNVVRAFCDLYRRNQQEFPQECIEADYEKRIRSAYPIHPEVFERLYSDWSTLQNFQRTRGVLRLMAAVIHSLWENDDLNPLIMPANVPVDDLQVKSELTRYLPDNWGPIIERDVDGEKSIPSQIDGEVPNLGKYRACRRVARTIYLGSAPIPTVANRGIEDRRIKLGCVAPGEQLAVFGDAMRRLGSTAKYLYQDGSRYWYSTQPTVAKIAEERAEEYLRNRDEVNQEIERRLRANLSTRGQFNRVHILPPSSNDVQDEQSACLVVLGPTEHHVRSKNSNSPAITAARSMMESRGNKPRLFRNTLVFLAADDTRLQDLEEGVGHYLAWQSILDNREKLDLPPHQVRQAESQRKAADAAATARIGETYQWLLVPVQANPQASVELQTIRLMGQGPLAERVSKRMCKDELLITSFAGTLLRMELDRIPLWRGDGDHVSVRQLVDDFARYCYLPRVKDSSVIREAICDGLKLIGWEMDSFAYADSYDDSAKRYRGLQTGPRAALSDSDPGLLVHPTVAREQMKAESEAVREGADVKGSDVEKPDGPVPPDPDDPPRPKPKRYHGSVKLDPMRVSRDANKVAEKVITHLAGLQGANVKVTLEIDANIPDGVPEQVIQIVIENSQNLNFIDSDFETE